MREGVTGPSPPVNKSGWGMALPTGLPSPALSDGGHGLWQHHGAGHQHEPRQCQGMAEEMSWARDGSHQQDGPRHLVWGQRKAQM